MAKRERKTVHRVQMTDGKRAIIQQLLQEYDIQDAKDIQNALKDLLGGTSKEMMEVEMDHHLGYETSERTDSTDEVLDYRNGYKTKQVNSSFGSMDIEVPQDIYGFEASEGFISDVTDKILPQIEEWQNRPLSAIYPIIFIDAIHFSVRDDSVIRNKLATYVVLGINLEGKKKFYP